MFSLTDCYQEAVKNFDFKQVEKVMTFLDWKWAGEKVTISEMKSVVYNLFVSCVSYLAEHKNKDRCTSGTGGFEVTVYTDEENNPFVSIKFILTYYEVEGQDLKGPEEKVS